MASPRRPQFVLFGSSIVQLSFILEGWGATLAFVYARQADIHLRGYNGWTSRQALQVVEKVFPPDAPVQPSLAIVYFGGNDSVLPGPQGATSHVPLPEFVENMRKIANHLKSLSSEMRIIYLTAPPVNEKMLQELWGDFNRTNEQCKIYADACVSLCQEINIPAINLFEAIQEVDDWLNTCFTDGIHFTRVASNVVAKEILKVIREADWFPSLHADHLPIEFADISPRSLRPGPTS